MTENSSVETKEAPSLKKVEDFTIIKPGLYTIDGSSIVRLVPKEVSKKEDGNKVRVIEFDESKLSEELKEEIYKDRGWQENLWEKLTEKLEHKIELVQRKVTTETQNPINFDDWKFVSKKYYPPKKCEITGKVYRASDSTQVVSPEYKEELLDELKKTLQSLQTLVLKEDTNINQLWSDVTKFKNRVIELNTKNYLSVRPYKNLRKEIQDIYNKAAVKRDAIKKEWEGKKAEKKQYLNELLEIAKDIASKSQGAEEVSSEVLTALKEIRLKAKKYEEDGLLPAWGVQKLFAVLSPISKREDEKKKKQNENRQEAIKVWRTNAKELAFKINSVNLTNESAKEDLLALLPLFDVAKENNEIGDKEVDRLRALIEEKIKSIFETANREKNIIKKKEKLKRRLSDEPTLREIYQQLNSISIGFVYNPENHALLQEILAVAEKLEESGVRKEDVDALKKQVREKLKTEESLKALSGK